jgi:hypothetical protein
MIFELQNSHREQKHADMGIWLDAELLMQAP